MAFTAPECTDSQSMLREEPKLKVYATISIRNGIISIIHHISFVHHEEWQIEWIGVFFIELFGET